MKRSPKQGSTRRHKAPRPKQVVTNNPFTDADDRPAVKSLLLNLKSSLPALSHLLEECSSNWEYEDPVYRLYHQSYKAYDAQHSTVKIVAALQRLAPERQLNPWFLQIVAAGTGKEFEPEHNAKWLEVVRPVLEAFFHARFMLEMAVRYGRSLERAPQMLPSGWAAFLYLFNLR